MPDLLGELRKTRIPRRVDTFVAVPHPTTACTIHGTHRGKGRGIHGGAPACIPQEIFRNQTHVPFPRMSARCRHAQLAAECGSAGPAALTRRPAAPLLAGVSFATGSKPSFRASEAREEAALECGVTAFATRFPGPGGHGRNGRPARTRPTVPLARWPGATGEISIPNNNLTLARGQGKFKNLRAGVRDAFGGFVASPPPWAT